MATQRSAVEISPAAIPPADTPDIFFRFLMNVSAMAPQISVTS